MRTRIWVATVLLVVAGARTAGAVVHAGDAAPNFRKAQLAAGPAVGTQLALADYAGKVVVLAIIGYS
jgi:hypothetical protein